MITILICVAIPATIISLIASIFAININSNILHVAFAIFILLIGIVSLSQNIKELKKKK